MTDYVEEQNTEVEALQAIYADEFELISENPITAEILVSGESGDENDPDSYHVKVSCRVQFTLPPHYPDAPPVIAVSEASEELEGDVEGIITDLNQQAGDNVGMVMIFTLTSAAQERLHDLAATLSDTRREVRERARREKEEAERKKFEGTRVSIDTFLAWKREFDGEIEAQRSAKQREELALLAGKLTGKELFLKDNKLNESDLQFIEDGEEDVKIDESLFEDLDDIDLDDAELDPS